MMKLPLQRNLVWLALGSLSLFILVASMAASGKVWDTEDTIFWSINNWPDTLKTVMAAVTNLGSVVILVPLLIITVYYRQFLLALQLCIGFGTTAIVATVAKHLVGRPRPFEMLSGVHQRVSESGYGFPSRHSAAAAVLGLTLIFVLKGKWRWLAVLWITAVGLSRVYLGVHMPLDIIGGVSLGVGIAACVHLTRPLWGQKARAFWLEIRSKAR